MKLDKVLNHADGGATYSFSDLTPDELNGLYDKGFGIAVKNFIKLMLDYHTKPELYECAPTFEVPSVDECRSIAVQAALVNLVTELTEPVLESTNE